MSNRIDLKTEQDTIDLAHYIAPLLGPGSIVTLSGELGSGKTFFVKALGSFLGISEDIDSPSFVLFKEYHCGRYPLYHLDLYRLKTEDELLDLGLLDMLESGITVIEWPEIAKDFLPYTTLKLHFGFDHNQRFVEITAEAKLEEYFNK
ncbi:MAG: tRNA (adenosine(37)-N6)-threonylcarbamoyltransferase complex ATPase subunit type 1 TsaE [Candidatus Cloacimonetes bacterium]|nr:tRNA (adenosine(37)-N6)-threonylcarbamoyltransferase complex ATPase subunit type 1 TsaE [Candidatus Cloacimonadota bacterium]